MRIYHHFTLWEEHAAGLWRRNPPDADDVGTLRLMQSTQQWAFAMNRVIEEWPYSCEQNLSHVEHNRVAWIGQAAVCLALGQPAEITKRTWWQLTKEERTAANNAAQSAIARWEVEKCPGHQLELTY